MAGSWMSVVYGFGGLRVIDGKLTLKPFLPKAWTEYSFKLLFREHLLKITVNAHEVIIEHQRGKAFELMVSDKAYLLEENSIIYIKVK